MAGTSKVRHRPRPDEWRQVSALFYDVVGSTQLIFSLGVEWYRTNVLRLHDVASASIARYGGLAEAPEGDGGRAYFGYQFAQEDAAERAICAALDILAWVKQQAAPAGKGEVEPLKVRLAVATGTVVTDVGDPQPDRQPRVYGVAPVLASRLQACADANSILVSEETYRATGALFRFQLVGPIDLKGFSERVSAWSVLGKEPARSRFTALRSPQTPLMGREAHLRNGLGLWEAVAAGRGQTLLVVGEAGIGKSRFAMEVRSKLAAVAVTLPVLQCQPREFGVPLHPLMDRLSELPRLEIDSALADADRPAGLLEFSQGIEKVRGRWTWPYQVRATRWQSHWRCARLRETGARLAVAAGGHRPAWTKGRSARGRASPLPQGTLCVPDLAAISRPQAAAGRARRRGTPDFVTPGSPEFTAVHAYACCRRVIEDAWIRRLRANSPFDDELVDGVEGRFARAFEIAPFAFRAALQEARDAPARWRRLSAAWIPRR
jgi:class 3 adenylate cyclase